MTDPAGKIRQPATDGLGRLVQVLGDPNGLKYTTAYSYDMLDDLLAVSQSGQSRSFAYDALRRLTQAVNPESGSRAGQMGSSRTGSTRAAQND